MADTLCRDFSISYTNQDALVFLEYQPLLTAKIYDISED
jgi:hypothetical protein